jgi:hypothetical protein
MLEQRKKDVISFMSKVVLNIFNYHSFMTEGKERFAY